MTCTLPGGGFAPRRHCSIWRKHSVNLSPTLSSRWLPVGLGATWQRAQLLDDVEREKLELTGFARAAELLAQSAFAEEPVERLMAMVLVIGLPAQWRYARGDFRGAIETALMAKEIAKKW